MTVKEGAYQDVTIAASVGDGEVIFNYVTIKGNLVVNGGGSNSIILRDTKLAGKTTISKTGTGGKTPPRIFIQLQVR